MYARQEDLRRTTAVRCPCAKALAGRMVSAKPPEQGFLRRATALANGQLVKDF